LYAGRKVLKGSGAGEKKNAAAKGQRRNLFSITNSVLFCNNRAEILCEI